MPIYWLALRRNNSLSIEMNWNISMVIEGASVPETYNLFDWCIMLFCAETYRLPASSTRRHMVSDLLLNRQGLNCEYAEPCVICKPKDNTNLGIYVKTFKQPPTDSKTITDTVCHLWQSQPAAHR
jgi:hypothetical protein